METAELYSALKKAVIEGDQNEAVRLAEVVVAENHDPVAAIEQGLREGITVIGEGFGRGEYFLPDLVISAETMKAASSILEQDVQGSNLHTTSVGCYVLGTVVGDLHDIGKTIFATLLTSYGFEVIDLGVDVKTEEFISAVREHDPQILGMSSLLTVTAKECEKVIKALEDEGLRKNLNIMVGGGAITADYAEKIGADSYGENAEDGARAAKTLLNID